MQVIVDLHMTVSIAAAAPLLRILTRSVHLIDGTYRVSVTIV